MRKSAEPGKVHRAHAWRRHLRGDRPYIAKTKVQGSSLLKVKEYRYSKIKDSSPFKNFSEDILSSRSKVKPPSHFCLFTDPERTLSFIGKTYNRTVRFPQSSIQLDHSKVRKYCIGAEVLLGMALKDAEIYLDSSGEDTSSWRGKLPKDGVHRDILLDVGIVYELESAQTNVRRRSSQSIRVFKEDCKSKTSASLGSDDAKTNAVERFIHYLDQCMRDQRLMLNQNAKTLLKKCMGEVIDNAEEHCGASTPRWHIRGHLNNGRTNEERILELCIFNFGCSYSDSLSNLPEEHYTAKEVSKYVEKHKDNTSTDALYTVAALQGRVSRKNESPEDNRGQGTIDMMEFFESLYGDYQRHVNSCNDCVELNLISGSVVVNFDEQYKMTRTVDEDGAMTVRMPFNREGSLASSPDHKVIKTMNTTRFPGAMINIRFPLTGDCEKTQSTQEIAQDDRNDH